MIVNSYRGSFGNRFCQRSAVKRKFLTQAQDVVQILHSTVSQAQADHRLEFFRDYALFWVR